MSDERQFLVTLNDTIRPLADPSRILAETCRLLGTHLRANRVAYGEVDGDVCTIVDDYVFDHWKGDLLRIADTNRDVAVSQDGVIAWVTPKDTPALTALLKDFFSTRKLTF